MQPEIRVRARLRSPRADLGADLAAWGFAGNDLQSRTGQSPFACAPRGSRAKTRLNHGFKAFNGAGLVGGVERHLVVVAGEAPRHLIRRMVPVAIGRILVKADLVPVVVSLKDVVVPRHPVRVPRDERAKDCGAEDRVVVRSERATDVVHRPRDDNLLALACVLSTRCGLKRVSVAIDLRARERVVQRLHEGKKPVGRCSTASPIMSISSK